MLLNPRLQNDAAKTTRSGFARFAFAFALLTLALPLISRGALPKLAVSANGRFLVQVTANNAETPFFWLNDTAWFLPRVSDAEVKTYLADRAAKGFTSVMMVAKFRDDVRLQNGSGLVGAFDNNNTDTPNAAYWSHIDTILTEAERRGLYVSLVVMWAEDYQTLGLGKDTAKANRLGRWLGARYRDRTNLIWVVSGEYDDAAGWSKALYNAVATGLRQGDGGSHLMTIHPGSTSRTDFAREPWLDFNLLQSGHQSDNRLYGLRENYELIASDLGFGKPVADGEPAYEATVDGFFQTNPRPTGVRIDEDTVRRKAYWSVFAGAFGHTFGNENIEIMYQPGDVVTFSHVLWRNALNSAGAQQMRHLRALMLSRSYLNRIPDQSIIVSANPANLDHVQATRAADKSYAFVYIPSAATVTVNLAASSLANSTVRVSWFNPRDGSTLTGAETVRTTAASSQPHTFSRPSGKGEDWVLILDSLVSAPPTTPPTTPPPTTPPTPPPSAGPLADVADTYVKENDNQAHGGETSVQVKGESPISRHGYLRFDISALPNSVKNARVQLALYAAAGWEAPGTAVAYEAGDHSWSESTVWSNRPSDSSLGAVLAMLPLPSDLDTDGTTWNIDVTDYVNAERAAGRTTLDLAFRSLANSNSGVAFFTREASNAAYRPKLIVNESGGADGGTPTPTPPPASANPLTLRPDVDSFIRPGAGPSEEEAFVDVKSQAGATRYGYLRFKLAPIDGPVKQAKLRLTLVATGYPGGWSDPGRGEIYEFNNNDWPNNAALANEPGSAVGALLGTLNLPVTTDGQVWEVDVTNYVNARLAADDPYLGFGLWSVLDNNSGFEFYSIEAPDKATQPQLLITQ